MDSEKDCRRYADWQYIFSVLADESRDSSNKEQMPLVIWYAYSNNQIQESFLDFIECAEGTTGEQIALLIENAFQTLGLDMNKCRGQGYNGAGNMSGVCRGAASIVLSWHPKAFYFHCASRKLNLCVAHSCKHTKVMNMMDAVMCLANFFNYSPQRQKELETHVTANSETSETQKSKLLPLCRTRWVERLDALNVTIDLWRGLQTL